VPVITQRSAWRSPSDHRARGARAGSRRNGVSMAAARSRTPRGRRRRRRGPTPA
jgi:hypothetical protein